MLRRRQPLPVCSECFGGVANTDLILLLNEHGIHNAYRHSAHRTTCMESTVRFAAEVGYDVTLAKDATADYADELVHAALVTTLPNYPNPFVTTKEVADSIPSLSAEMTS